MRRMYLNAFVLLVSLALLPGCSGTVRLGQTQSGAAVSFGKDATGGYRLLVQAPVGPLHTDTPAAILLFPEEGDGTTLKTVYRTVRKTREGVEALADIESDGSVFAFRDLWRIEGDALTLDRTVRVQGTCTGAGFSSLTGLQTSVDFRWEDGQYVFPGVVYGRPHTNALSKGGSKYFESGFFCVREDNLSAPLAVVSDSSFGWFGLLDPSPDGATTWTECTSPSGGKIIDAALGFGALDAGKLADGGVSLSFIYPGSCREFEGGGPFRRSSGAEKQVLTSRLHPVQDGFMQHYSLRFLFGRADSLPGVERDAWRAAWKAMDPKVVKVDVEQVRTTLLDHLADRVIEYGDRAGVPFVIDAKSGKPGSFRPAMPGFNWRGAPNPELPKMQAWAESLGIDFDPSAAELNIWEYAVIGFCGKHVEIAEQFLLESYRDGGERGKRFRRLAEEIMATMVKYAPMNPPVGEGINLRTGRVGNIHGGNAFGLRPIPEDMARLMDLVVREKARGVEHPDWLAWGRDFADWLLPQQRTDGSFPDGWGNDGAVNDEAGAMSYAPIPMLLKLAALTGEAKYREAAVRAGEYLWQDFGISGVYQGATGGSDVADKESGMLSTEAFLALYEDSGEQKWLDRAEAAASYTESWIWIWNVPMPIGADPAILGWKPGVPTTGVNGIGSNDVGGVDQYLDWAVPQYAKLYKLTGDAHYLDVARVLLHGTKAMLALPGRSYDLAGPGWQQEHWRMSARRGTGAHRTWLPWISINHLHGITALEDFDSELYARLCE